MAFENNQQDAFNLRNDTESLKQWQAELDKATTAIGAAEVAAEEELAALKFKNLVALQDAKVAKLEQLIALEDKGIKELAKARLTLSDRQFELRKKEIQKEFQMAKKAAEELLKVKNKKAKAIPEKTTSTAKDVKATNKAKNKSTATVKNVSGKVVSASGTKKISDTKNVTPELVALVNSIDGTLTSLHDITAGYINSKEVHEPALPPELIKPAEVTKHAAPVQEPEIPVKPELLVQEPVVPIKPVPVTQESAIQQEPVKGRLSEAAIGEDLLSVLKTDGGTLITTTEQILAEIKTRQETKNTSSTTKDLQNASGKPDNLNTPEHPSNDTVPADGAGSPPNHPNEAKPKTPESREYSDDVAGLEKVKLGVATLKDITDGLAVNRKYFDSIKQPNNTNPTLDLLNEIIAEATNDRKAADKAKEKKEAIPESKVSQTTLDLTDSWLKSIDAASEAEEELYEFKKDLERNSQLVAFEQEQSLRKALADTEKQLITEQSKTEATIAFNRAHADELMAQELHKKSLGYLKEYTDYQKKAGKYAVSKEDFEKNRAQKERASAKNEASSAIADAIKTGQFSKIWSTDSKEAYSKYMGLRTAELEESYMAKFDRNNPNATEDERKDAAAKAAASAKLTAQFEIVADAARNLAQALNAQTDKIGAKQAPIDTRLQGSRVNDKILGSYWKQLARDMNKIGAVNPYFTQDDFANNIETLVNKGISFDIKQRAFLMTIQEKIANTFDVADGTLLRLVRIQQQDTTAGRLGMESALNSFLNSMYETSEYLSDVAASVRSSLGEMQALMEGAAATELEFQVQKWMGSLYSVGMSQDAVQSIAQTFGQIASGDVGGLTGSGTGNLLIMAANEAGMSIADILQDGLNADETNTLMQAMVNYLAEIAETSSDSRVVQQQLANVYGVKASDLRAATNLASSLKDVSKQDLTYSGMLGQLNKMANSMILRTSTGEMLTNVWDNVQYTMATQMANDPILYLLPRVATLLEDYAGGIDLPFLNVMGFGVDLNTSVAQLMNVAALSGSILGALGPMISGLASAASGSVMLSLAGINTSGKAPVIARGSAQPLQHLSGSSLSESGYVGNASGEDVKKATLQDADDSKKKQLVEAKDEENVEDVSTKADLAVVNIYNLLEEVAHGSQSLRVRLVGLNGSGGLNIGSGGGHSVIGDSSSAGSTGAMGGVSLANKVNEGNDNGNWVLAF